MFKTERVPVTLFQSTDEGAPQLTDAAGSVKTILKACLVTGYGSKQALGWEGAFEDDNYMAFRSKDEKSTKCWVSVDNAHPRSADMVCFHEMTGKKTGSGAFSNWAVPFLSYDQSRGKWVLIGHKSAFIFLCTDNYSGGGSQFFYFGDFNTLNVSGKRTVIIKKVTTPSYGSLSANNGAMYYGFFPVTDSDTGGAQIVFNKSYDGLRYSVGGAYGSAGITRNVTTYPSANSNGFSAFDCYLYESVPVSSSSSSSSSLIGKLGGIFKVAEKMSGIEEFATFKNIDDSGDAYLKFCTGKGGRDTDCFLVNCTAWEL